MRSLPGSLLATVLASCGLVAPLEVHRSDIDAAAPGGDAGPPGDGPPTGHDAGTPPLPGDAAPAPPDGGLDDLARGLVARWRLDEESGTTAADDVAHPGTVLGAVEWTRSGRIGGALRFDGTTTRVAVSAHPALAVGPELTFAAWVELLPTAYDQRVFSLGYSFSIKLNGRRPQIYVGEGYARVDLPLADPPRWQHIAVTCARGVAIWYIDGIAVPLASSSTLKPGAVAGPTTHKTVIGGPPGSDQTPGALARGAIDDVRVWSRALEAAEIAAVAAGR